MKTSWIGLVATVAMGAATLAAQNTALVPSHKPSVAATSSIRPAEALVARVSGVGLTQRELNREMQKLFPYARTHGGRIPDMFQAEVRRNALHQIILDELAFQEAKRRKMAAPAAMFSELMRQAKGRFASQKEFEAYAAQEYGSVKGFESQIRRGLLVALLLDQEIAQKSKVTDAKARLFYAENKKRFLKPESVWVQSISFNFPENAAPGQRAQARKRAEEILPKARAAQNFEEFGRLAEKYSEDDWRIMMGDHKWIHRGRMPSAVENVAFTMKAGQTSAIIETSEAFVIVRVNGRKSATQIPYAEVSKDLRAELQKATEMDLWKRFEARLRKTFKVEEL
jgi:peptidyl-prolyl cis-trans isomerase SurA